MAELPSQEFSFEIESENINDNLIFQAIFQSKDIFRTISCHGPEEFESQEHISTAQVLIHICSLLFIFAL